MLHTTWYRKWRPVDFASVVGQSHITDVLRYQVDHGTTSHAYLFCGSRGTGKTTCAKILAKAINCLSPVNGNPCLTCDACRAIEEGSATDIVEMDAASNNGVDYIRDIRDEVVYTPAFLKKRVYIIDEVHMLSAGAFNALLKTLEEPPAHVVFILATTELQKLPATITSRCQRFDFHRILSTDIADRLMYIAGQEGVALTYEAGRLIGRLSEGGMRDSISLLELCAGTGKTVDVDLVNKTAGVTGRAAVGRIIDALYAKKYDVLFSSVSHFASSGIDLSVFWQGLLGYLRDMLLVRLTADPVPYLDLTEDEYRETAAVAEHFSKERLLYLIRLAEDALVTMQKSQSLKRQTVEMTLIRMADESLSTTNEALLARIERLETNLFDLSHQSRISNGSEMPQQSIPDCGILSENDPLPDTGLELSGFDGAEEKAEESSPDEGSAEDLSADIPKNAENAAAESQLQDHWAEIVADVERVNPGAAATLKRVTAYQKGKRVVLVVGDTFSKMLLDTEDSRSALADAIRRVCGPVDIDNASIGLLVRKESDASTDPLASLSSL